MKFQFARSLAAVAVGMALAGSAAAHVGYGSALWADSGVFDPLTSTGVAGSVGIGALANFTATVSSNAGYVTGLDPYTLGNTHDIRFRYFILGQQSTVSFTINGTTNSNGASTLNPGFSLYSGVVPASSHDGVGDIANIAGAPNTSAYLATAPQFASWSPFVGVNGVRGGAAAGTPGNPTGLWGVFDTNGNITVGNNGAWTATSTAATDTHGPNYLGGLDTPKIATITYLGISGADALAGATFTDSQGGVQSVIGADGLVDNKVSWTGTLGPGIYTLAIGGANLTDAAQLVSDVVASNGGLGTDTAAVARYNADRLARGLTVTDFTVTAVPEPETWGMLLSGLAVLGAVAGRRRGTKRLC